MKITNPPLFYTIIFLLVLFFTFILRAHNYDRTPELGHLEEMLFAWSGIYFIETGTPVSWSTLDYPKKAQVFSGKKTLDGSKPEVYVNLYKPWLDEPPLFSLMVGWFAHLYGADRNSIIPTSYIRLPMIFFATVTSVMVFLVTKLISNYWTAILAMLVYGVTPIFVIGSRLAVPENLIAMLFMIIFYLLLNFQINPGFRYIFIIPILIGIAGLSKPTGFLVLLFVIFCLILKMSSELYKWKMYIRYLSYLVLLTLPFILGFFLYGIYMDSEIFWKIVSIQSFRPVGFNSLGWFFVSPAYDINSLTDSWYIFSLVSAAYFLFAPPTGLSRLVVFAFIFLLAVVMISGGEGDLLPWYRFPLFPIMSILSAWGLQLMIKRADLFSSFVVTGMLLGGRSLAVNEFQPNVSPTSYRVLFTALNIIPAMRLIWDTKMMKFLSKMILLLVIGIGVYWNVVYIYNQFELRCIQRTCPIGPATFFSTLHLPLAWRALVLF